MATEIEMKFLVRADTWRAEPFEEKRLVQGYLSTENITVIAGTHGTHGDLQMLTLGFNFGTCSGVATLHASATAVDEFAPMLDANGCLDASKNPTIRVRKSGTHATGILTIKSPSTDGGLSRLEFEYSIPLDIADELLKHTTGTIEKIRYTFPVGDAHPDLYFELDVFDGENTGLQIVEVELPDVGYKLTGLPSWVGENVTARGEFTNGALSRKPFSSWDSDARAAVLENRYHEYIAYGTLAEQLIESPDPTFVDLAARFTKMYEQVVARARELGYTVCDVETPDDGPFVFTIAELGRVTVTGLDPDSPLRAVLSSFVPGSIFADQPTL